MINSAPIALLGFAAFLAGYGLYSRYLAARVFRLDPDFRTPAHEYQDGVDHLPTNRYVLWGHHFTSVAGAAPIIGPAIAVIWGWLPALIWVLLGTVFIAGVHDFGTLWASVRHKGRSMGTLAGEIIHPRARVLFLLVIFFLLLMVNAVFAVAIAKLFISFPASVLPYWLQIPIAVTVGILVYRRGAGIVIPALIALGLLLALIALGAAQPISLPKVAWGVPDSAWWVIIMLAYGAIASRLPVWLLLQPRDFINSHLLFIGLVAVYAGLFVAAPDMVAPAVNMDLPADIPPILPLLFVTIACGAISGFHGLVSSGTTAKQLDRETDSRFVGYLGAVGEGLLALAAILATAAGLGAEAWKNHYGSWAAASSGGITAFVEGAGNLLANLGLPEVIGTTFIAIMVVAFAATTLDTSMRLQRFILAEIGHSYRLPALQSPNLGSALSFAACAALAFLANPDDPGAGGMILWPLFGTTNQLIAGLSLLVMTLLLHRLGRNYLVSLIPFLFVTLMTAWAMLINLGHFLGAGNYLLTILGGTILVLNAWILLEGVAAIRRERTGADASVRGPT